MELINTTYCPKDFEEKLYKFWEDNGYFKANVKKGVQNYTVILPPPNVTGILHIGHCLNGSIQDCIVRYKKMKGFNTLWIPGVDHAGIATQNKVEKLLASENTSKEKIGREEFLKRTFEWKEKYGNIITTQFRKIGASLDWSRERFTMDQKSNEAVREAFVRMYNDGLIYQGEYIVNWCPKDTTALADDEVEYSDNDSFIWHIEYKIKDSDKSIVIATTRPETMLGDSAIAVNPNDSRYSDLIGKFAILPLVNRQIPIISDEYVDMEFGTGALKITPAHDPNDFQIGKKHNLEFINIFTKDAKINELGGVYQGLDRFEARKKIVSDLENIGQLVKIQKHLNAVGHCYRCHSIIEPRVSRQWFVKMKPLAELSTKAVREKKITIEPKRAENIYYSWMENIHDWCISRQICWGHQIPAYYDDKGNVYVAKSLEEAQKLANTKNLTQDQDVLDTWFSSALWPFSSLGWPDKTQDLSDYFPTDTLITGIDIIFFWVSRMIMTSLYLNNEIPFKHVHFNGIVRDEIGRKMSKSLGNSPDPLDIINTKGADALRFGLLYNTSQCQDIRFSDSLVDMGANFVNKVWNASKFILSNLQDYDINTSIMDLDFKLEDKYILSKLNSITKEYTKNMDDFNIDIACKYAYDFFKNDFCDWYLEIAKTRIYGATDIVDKNTASYVLRHCLDYSLRLLHPFIPFVTEYIWQKVKLDGDTILNAQMPIFDKLIDDQKSESDFEFLKESITAIRNIRSSVNASPSRKLDIIIKSEDNNELSILIDNPKILDKLANCKIVEKQVPNLVGSRVVRNTQIFIPLDDLIDRESELEKIDSQIKKTQQELDKVLSKLSNEQFISKAPAQIIEKENKIKNELETKISKLKENRRLYE